MIHFWWKAKRDVHMLTIVHTPDIVDTDKIHYATGETIRKSACVVDYCKHMGGVDKTDMQISLTEYTHRTRKKCFSILLICPCIMHMYYIN